MEIHSSERLYVGAIDFGTTYSGYAFSTKDDYNADPLKVKTSAFVSASKVSLKTSTCVLFDPDKNFHSFGFEAEDKFNNLAENDEHHEWYYFRRFKMKLYENEKLTRATTLKDEQGNSMSALDIFATAIKYMKDELLTIIATQELKESDIQWVLTIPAIWNDTAKAFMREAAQRAGIKGNQLTLALEPEAAAVYCKHLDVVCSVGKNNIDIFARGARYLVLDAGGGTVDITVHEITNDSKMREMFKANGGDWGGTKVDHCFIELLEVILGKDVMDTFAAQYRADYIDLLRGFEVRKRNISNANDTKLTIHLPVTLCETFAAINPLDDIQDAIRSNSKYASSVSLFGDKLRITSDVARELFKTSIENVINHLHKLFQSAPLNDVQCILMVGGFSESLMLQEAIKAEYGEKLHIIIPHEPGLAVLKGAVIFGHDRSIVKTRICRFTYGIVCSQPFIEGLHPDEGKFQRSDGTYYCDNIILKMNEEGTEINVGDCSTSETLNPLEPDDTVFETRIVSSKERDVRFVTDEGCNILGSLNIDMPDTSRGLDRQVIYTMTFGDTELKVKAKDRDSDREVEAKFQFI